MRCWMLVYISIGDHSSEYCQLEALYMYLTFQTWLRAEHLMLNYLEFLTLILVLSAGLVSELSMHPCSRPSASISRCGLMVQSY